VRLPSPLSDRAPAVPAVTPPARGDRSGPLRGLLLPRRAPRRPASLRAGPGRDRLGL
jgi:hypothetical protein